MGQVEVYLIFCLSAFLAGVLNSIAGGGTLLTFPPLAAILDPALANATSTVALLPGSFAGALGYRRELWECRHFTLKMLVPCLIGGGIGAWLVGYAPDVFAQLVPWLILTAAVLFLLQRPINQWIRKNTKNHGDTNYYTKSNQIKFIAILIFQFSVAVYGGYFGAGIGILMLSSLGYMNIGNIHNMNAVKTFLAASINTASVLIFIWNDMVIWRYAIPMSVAAIMGGYCGARAARLLAPEIVRTLVILIAFGLTIYYFAKHYFIYI
jgi:uncharacterized membrane protein YfcA